ncbi:DUF3349 domain-containing protein [Microlunatus ginsengisoli]|uniref:DUF3349 domain-containing protein n=1 Tax=Microlunatus ginsengisoli TaxID=363863 RepID=UPI0031DC00A3
MSSPAETIDDDPTPAAGDTRPSLLRRILDWLSVGYPTGVPPTERVALLALLNRTLTEAEVAEVITRLTAEGGEPLADGVISEDEIRQSATDVLHEAPTDDDLRKVSVRLAAAGWPLEGTFARPEDG